MATCKLATRHGQVCPLCKMVHRDPWRTPAGSTAVFAIVVLVLVLIVIAVRRSMHCDWCGEYLCGCPISLRRG